MLARVASYTRTIYINMRQDIGVAVALLDLRRLLPKVAIDHMKALDAVHRLVQLAFAQGRCLLE
jgi:hypothetical protein